MFEGSKPFLGWAGSQRAVVTKARVKSGPFSLAIPLPLDKLKEPLLIVLGEAGSEKVAATNAWGKFWATPLTIFKKWNRAPLNILGGAGSQRAAVTKARGKSGFLLPLSLLAAGHIRLWFAGSLICPRTSWPQDCFFPNLANPYLPNIKVFAMLNYLPNIKVALWHCDMLLHLAECSNLKVKGSGCIQLDGLCCTSCAQENEQQ